MTERTPWPALLAAAQRCGVPPGAFWRLSVREWRALASAPNETLSRAAFAALVQRFPDVKHDRT